MTTRTKIRKKLLAAHRKLREFRMLVKGLVSTRHPVLVHIIPIRRCNLACTYCNEFDDFSKPVPLEEMFRRIDRLGAMGTSVITISGGEPLLHPELDAIIARIRKNGIMAGLITNGYLSGQVARDLFAIGVVGLGLLAIPVLAGSAAYALAEAFDWTEGLSRRFTEARGFYGVIIVSTGVGLLLNFVGIDPIKALVFTAVFNGIAAVPLLFLIGKINDNGKILGTNRGGPLSRSFVWLSFVVMALAAVGLLYTTVFHS